MRTTIYILCIFSFTSSWGQKNKAHIPDIPALKRAKHDTTKINILLDKIGLKYESINPDSSLYFYNLAVSIAQNSLLSSSHNRHQKNKFLRYQAVAFRYIGIIYRTKGLFDNSMENYLKALKIAEELEDKILRGLLYLNIGNVLYEQQNYFKSQRYYKKGLKMGQELKDQKGVAEAYLCIARNYFAQHQLKTAMKHSVMALKIIQTIDYEDGLPFCYSTMGLIEEKQKNYQKAMTHFKNALDLSVKIEDINAVASIHLYLAQLYLTLVDSTSLTKTEKRSTLMKALRYGEQGLVYAQTLKSFTLQHGIANCLLKANEKLDRPREALHYAQLIITTNDSVFHESKIRISEELESKYTAKNNRLQIEKLGKDSELQQAKINRQKIVLIFFIGASLLIFLFLLLLLRLFKLKKNATISITSQRDEIIRQNERMSEQARLITDSINYAKRIQQVIFPSSQTLKEILGEHFVLLKAKDIVSGDFYWATRVEDYLIIALADCTGHGVPGALMSMLGMANLNEIVRQKSGNNAAKILNSLRDLIIKALNQRGDSEEQKDGMDLALCVINTHTLEMQFSGAYLSCLLFKNNSTDFLKIEGDPMPIGIHPQMKLFTNKMVPLEKGDTLYLMSDGFQDQFGGPKNRKFLSKNITKLLSSLQNLPLSTQKQRIDETIENWKKQPTVSYEQTDDITILGFKVNFTAHSDQQMPTNK
jgi:serine phosphatase RsbU (regulator of sigma subunit)